MSSGILEAPAPTTVQGDVAIPEISSASPGGAQGVKPAPAGTIPPPLKAFSDRPDSAKSKMFQRMRERSGEKPAEAKPAAESKPAAEQKSTPETKPAPEAKEGEQPEVEEYEIDEEQESLMEDGVKKPKAEEAKPVEGEKKKPNPWKLVDEHKTARAKAEAEIAELRKQIINPEVRKSEVAELEALRKEKRELLEKIRVKDYESHPEFQQTYDQPYKNAWKQSMRNLQGVTKTSDDGTRSMEMTADDMLELVNAPTAKARQIANEKFGEMADDVMLERDKIRTAYDARVAALEKNRTDGAQAEEKALREQREAAQALSSELKEIYTKANEYHSKDPKMAEFFQPIDGDEDANSMLEKGYKMVDEAFAKSPMDPSLTPKERASLVKKHAAVRHRAAAFTRARHLLAKERAAHEETKRQLAEFKGTVPNRGPAKVDTAPAVAQGGTKMQQMQARLRARAK